MGSNGWAVPDCKTGWFGGREVRSKGGRREGNVWIWLEKSGELNEREWVTNGCESVMWQSVFSKIHIESRARLVTHQRHDAHAKVRRQGRGRKAMFMFF